MIFDLELLAKVFAINLSYVTLSTIRFMLTMKGYRVLAPLLSMVEIVIYVLGLSMVMSSLDNPLNLAAYALGYGAGIGIGIKIEDWLALGYTMITVMTQDVDSPMPNQLRNLGYGVSSYRANGRDGERLVLEILLTRKAERHLQNKVLEIDPKAFMVSYDPKYIHGGFWSKRVHLGK
ncbi:DUF2179 domain-containing protein [Trichococcus ilyis]|uniref:UPF0316 protein SAMN05216375_103146 n=1 Tax=Trichococcus ilyis TaxID=640938 RepID=A0A143YLQ4_9LACT|nr:DUF2179 domain-containing protein [Trichococcus ilyis]CZQ91985.1 Hypothetical protein TR210_1015 [Trichococcus ilyis]SEI77224.1 Uncharacterized protein YebE, UPF0316 family [Trichococcus ilyis]